MDERSIIRGWGLSMLKRKQKSETERGCLWIGVRERMKGGLLGLVTAHKPTLRTITVTNRIVFVATTQRNTS